MTLPRGRTLAGCLLALASLAQPRAARAVAVANCAELTGASVECRDRSSNGALSFDLFVFEIAPVALSIAVSPLELALGTIVFDAFVYNETGGDLTRLRLALEGGATFETVGTVRDFSFELASVSSTSATARIIPAQPVADFELLEIGAIEVVPGAEDWSIGVGTLTPESPAFALIVQPVPEPHDGAWIACLSMALLKRRASPRAVSLGASALGSTSR